MVWHHGHHQLCSETITNFFSLAARSKVASDHSFQKPSVPRSLRSTACAVPSKRANVAPNRAKNRIMDFSANRDCSPYLQPCPFGGPIKAMTRDREEQ